jgi:hypothetical protein
MDSLQLGWHAAACRELLDLYMEEKTAGKFEIRRPRTTKEVTLHNNQLMQNMPQLVAAVIPQQQGGVAAWCEEMQRKPSAPRPSADELERMMERAEWLNEEGIGGCRQRKVGSSLLLL